MAGVQKGEKRPWVAGKPKFTNGELHRVTLLLADKHIQFLHQQGNVSATVRRLIEEAIADNQKPELHKVEKDKKKERAMGKK